MSEPLDLACIECGQPMTWTGTSTRWEGDYEINVVRFADSGCHVTAEVTYRYFIPIAEAQRRAASRDMDQL